MIWLKGLYYYDIYDFRAGFRVILYKVSLISRYLIEKGGVIGFLG
jgi:hypothetical protein